MLRDSTKINEWLFDQDLSFAFSSLKADILLEFALLLLNDDMSNSSSRFFFIDEYKEIILLQIVRLCSGHTEETIESINNLLITYYLREMELLYRQAQFTYRLERDSAPVNQNGGGLCQAPF